MNVLLLNAGSSSLKCTLMDSARSSVRARATVDWAGPVTRYERTDIDGQRLATTVTFRGHGAAARQVIDDLAIVPGAAAAPAVVGHRIVHGGAFRSAVRVTDDVRSRIAALADLAPLHNPPGLETLAAAEQLLPRVPHVAVFDTAFHSTLSATAYTYPIPQAWTTVWGIRRYGFHGLSHAYCATRAAQLLERKPQLRLIVCHLGHGCSATAVVGGRSVDTTMGFTPLDGLMMATRSGAVDPGILAHVQTRHGLSADQVDDALNRESGLLGISGISADMREVLAAADTGNERARLAIDVYAHRVRQAIGALAVTMGGVDALVFTAGVGENAAPVRAAVCRGLEVLGLELDPDANARSRPDADIARAGSSARILVLVTREDLAMLAEILPVLAS